MKTISRTILLALILITSTANSHLAVAQTAAAKPKASKAKPAEAKDQQQDSDQDKDSDDDTQKKSKPDKAEKKQKKKPAKKPNNTRMSPDFVSVFEPVSESMEQATASVFSDGEQVALGTVIEADGLILTKASELKHKLVCKIGDEEYKAKIIGIHAKTDLALLKIDADDLDVIRWSDHPAEEVGNWVVSPKAQEGNTAVGVISTLNLRQIKRSKPFVGIGMTNKDNGIQIISVVNRSPADISGLLVGDVIYKIDGQPVKEISELQSLLGQFDAGDRVTLDVIRFKEEVQIRVTLAEYEKLAPSSQRSNQQNSMGSELSRRRKDFPLALQHDSMLQSNTCGGPLLDLSGDAIGINIARAGRVASYALPIETVLPVVALLKTGELTPAIVNKEKIVLLDVELKELREELESMPERKAVLNIQVNSEMAVRNELRKTIAEMESILTDQKKRLAETEERYDRFRNQMNIVRKKLRSGEKTIKRLEEDLDGLRTGSR